MVSERLPPHDLDAEEAVIGSLLIDGSTIHKVANLLKPEYFYHEQTQWLYEACQTLYERAEAINQITLAQELARRNKLETCGGAAYLSRLIAIVPTSLDIEYYAQIVYRLAILRGLISAGGQIAAIGYQGDPDIETNLGKAEKILFGLRRTQGDHDLTHIRQVLDKYFEAPPPTETKRLPYVLSSFSSMDEFLGGFQRSDLIIIGGRPSMGKTSLALNIARNAAIEQKACVALFSLEMGISSLVLRLLSSESGVNSRRVSLHHPEYDAKEEIQDRWEDEERRIMEAIGVLSEAPIYIDDTPMISISELRSKALHLNYEHAVDMVVVDHLQLMQGGGRNENRTQEISYISRSLKALARELNSPVIAVSQLSRAPEGRLSHEPQLSDLRESGGIEQDADVVLFIYREEYYYNEETWQERFPDKKYPKEEADIIIAKNRNGPTDRMKLRFRHNLAKFYNVTTEEPSLL